MALPLVLSGPMLRKATRNAVHVFVALHRPCTVRLTVWEDEGGQVGRTLMFGEALTIPLGPGLHVALISARRPAEVNLTWGVKCSYDLTFLLPEGARRLGDAGVLHQSDHPTDLDRLVYPGRSLPGFQLASSRAERLRVFHGSCRKPHGEGDDALALLDAEVAAAWEGDGLMPQHLFLTGDQIYADDVHPALLRGIQVIEDLLLGHDERTELTQAHGGAMAPGQRQALANQAGFTTEYGANHLATLGEFLGMYLLTWSPALWTAAGIDHAALKRFRATLPQVRRALAHVSTGMIFDDHEVTDDWNLRADWVHRVGARPLGRRIVRNALAAYAVFQHWGNAPENFDVGRPGAGVLATLAHRGPLGAPESLDGVFGGLPTQKQTLSWGWAWKDNQHLVHIIALDCRTRRGFTGPENLALMTSVDIDRELDRPASENPAFSIVISPAPVLGSSVFDWLQKTAAGVLGLPKADYEPWSACSSYDMLINHLFHRAPALVLSGDVHFAFVASGRARQGVHAGRRIVNCTASSLKNQSPALATGALALAEELFGTSPLAPFATLEGLVPQINFGSVPCALVALTNIGDVTWPHQKVRQVLRSRAGECNTAEAAFELKLPGT